jgi:hypothetical protein
MLEARGGVAATTDGVLGVAMCWADLGPTEADLSPKGLGVLGTGVWECFRGVAEVISCSQSRLGSGRALTGISDVPAQLDRSLNQSVKALIQPPTCLVATELSEAETIFFLSASCDKSTDVSSALTASIDSERLDPGVLLVLARLSTSHKATTS